MKILDLLPKSNDQESQFEKTLIRIQRSKNEDEPIQLDLGLKESPLNKLFEVRQKLDRFEDRIKLSHYTRNIFLWIMFFFPALVAGFTVYRYYNVANQMPDNVPLMWMNYDISTLLLPKYWLVVLTVGPFIAGFLCILLFRFSYRRLEKAVFMVMCFIILSSTLSLFIFDKVVGVFV